MPRAVYSIFAWLAGVGVSGLIITEVAEILDTVDMGRAANTAEATGLQVADHAASKEGVAMSATLIGGATITPDGFRGHGAIIRDDSLLLHAGRAAENE